MDDSPEKTKKIIDLAPLEWLQTGLGDSTVIRGYRAILSPDSLPDTSPCSFDLTLVRAILVKAKVNYFDAGKMVPLQNNDDSFEYEIRHGGDRSTAGDWHLLLLSPYRWDDWSSEAIAWTRIDEATGLLAAINGMRAIYEHVFDNKARFGPLEVAAVSASVRTPQTLRKPLWNSEALATIQGAASAIERLPMNRRGSLQVSLRWFSESFRARGVDIFLKRWIAIETLTMPVTTNIKPLIKLLAEVYAGESARFPTDFGIGRIYGRRCRVVHDGEKAPVLGLLLDYLEAIYTDCLYAITGMKSPRRVEEIFVKEGPELSGMLAQL